MMKAVLCFSVFLLGACSLFQASPDQGLAEEAYAPPVLTAASFAQLPGWGQDDFSGFAQAFSRSCDRMAKQPAERAFGALKDAGTYGDWQGACAVFAASPQNDPRILRAFFETYFTPYAVSADGESEGLFTGYYEASLHGSRVRTPKYNVPLYVRADDLVMVDLGEFREELKGQRIAGRVVGGNLKPYESREEIVAGRWPHNDKVLVWLDDPVDAFFVQIQGSGVVELAEGGVMRIGYAGQNGHPYYAIGRELIKRGELTKDTVSMESIRAWLEANPYQADELMNANASYVFFKELEGEDGGPMGGEGVALTPERSVAVDRSLMAYGLPLWVDLEAPAPASARLQRMMVAQDTGGAIRGAVRGDVFWGAGRAPSRWRGL